MWCLGLCVYKACWSAALSKNRMHEHNHPSAPIIRLEKDKAVAKIEQERKLHQVCINCLKVMYILLFMISLRKWFVVCVYYRKFPQQVEVANGVISQLPSFYSLKSSLYWSRREHLPPMPHSHSNLDLSGEWCKTVNEDNFVLANDGQMAKL